jgi:hypothetical protein
MTTHAHQSAVPVTPAGSAFLERLRLLTEEFTDNDTLDERMDSHATGGQANWVACRLRLTDAVQQPTLTALKTCDT